MSRTSRTVSSSAALAAAVALLTPALTARADTASTFANFAPGVSLNEDLSIDHTGTPITGTGQLAFDPNNPDTLYLVNRIAPPNGGIYPFRASTRTRITNSNGEIFIGDGPDMTWTDGTDPYAAVVGNDGSLYVAMFVSAGIYRIQNPLSDAPAITRIMGSYPSGGGDDDMVNIQRMPANFGLANYGPNDLLFFDDGNNANDFNAVVALHSDGSDGNVPTIVWKRDTPAAGGTIHGAANPVDGYAYWINTVPEHNTIDGVDRVSVYRVNGTGILQTIGLDLPAGITLASADDPIAINPVDGSLWLADVGASGDRTMLRIDLASLTASASDPNAFLATAAAQFTASTFNMGVNGMEFTPDGTKLYIGTPSNADKTWVFNVTPVLPPSLTGDTNNDGVVDLVDLNNVLNNFGATGTSPGDDNNDGVVDLVDLNNVLNNFGNTAATGALSVIPEPTALSLLALPSLALLRRRRA